MIGPIVAAALWAVLASLVLCLVLGAAVFGVITAFRPAASTRQALWSIALGAAGIAPVVILAVMLLRGANCNCDAMTTHVAPAAAPIHVSVPASTGDAKSPAHASYAYTYTASDAVPAARGALLRLPDPPDITPLVADAIVAMWALGALGGLIGLGRSLFRVRGLKLRSSPLDGDLATDLPWLTTTKGREIYVRLSYETETPIAVGFRRPVILIPTEMATAAGLTSIEPLVMHEYAHLARYDDWTNLVQRAIERVFWFNPLVWILGRRIALEREVAADEAVVARTHDAKNYASALWRMAQEMRMPEHVVVAPGAMLTRKQISVRIERLLEEAPLGGRKFGAAGLVLAAFAFTAVAAVAAGAPAVSLAQNDEPPMDAVSPAPHLIVLKPHVAGAPKPQPLAHVAASSAAIGHPLILKRVVVADVPAAAPAASVAPVAPVAPVGPVSADSVQKVAAHIAEQAAQRAAAAMGPPPAIPAPPDLKDLADLQQLKDLGPKLSAEVQRDIAESTRVRHDRSRDHERSNAPLTREMVQSCMGCDFSHRDLHGLDLSGISLLGDDFSHADLSNVNFAGASLKGVSFDHAVLTNVNMQAAKLTGVDLSGAVLNNANLGDALLTGVDLSGASMNNVNTRNLHMIGSTLP